MKNKKILIIMLVSVCIIGGVIVVAMNIWKDQDPPIIDDPPILKGNGVDKEVKESIFKMVSEEPNKDIGSLVNLDENGVPSYIWQNIEVLLHKNHEDMKIEEYATLIQTLQKMTEIRIDGTVITDYTTLEQWTG